MCEKKLLTKAIHYSIIKVCSILTYKLSPFNAFTPAKTAENSHFFVHVHFHLSHKDTILLGSKKNCLIGVIQRRCKMYTLLN